MSTNTDKEMMIRWMKENGLHKQPTTNICLRKVAGLRKKGCKNWGSRTRGTCVGLCEKVCYPFMDHRQFFKKPGVPGFWLVSHAYSYSEKDLEIMERVRAEYGLVTEVFDRDQSWYNPGETHLIIIRPESCQ